ncbi:MAG TPA: hypothetical protein VGA92_04665 [Candidatus Nitrosotenuis sp.]
MCLRYAFLLLFVVMLQNVYAQDLPVKLADSTKKTVEVGKQIQIAADLKNNQDVKQDFAYIVQIQNEDGVIVSLAWITGTLAPAQSFTPALSWIPNEEGRYEATIFVWESINNPSALSPTLSLGIDVNQFA